MATRPRLAADVLAGLSFPSCRTIAARSRPADAGFSPSICWIGDAADRPSQCVARIDAAHATRVHRSTPWSCCPISSRDLELPPGDTDFSLVALIKIGFAKSIPRPSMEFGPHGARRTRYLAAPVLGASDPDDEDFRRHVEYCYFNPVKHGLVTRVRIGRFVVSPRCAGGIMSVGLGCDLLSADGDRL